MNRAQEILRQIHETEVDAPTIYTVLFPFHEHLDNPVDDVIEEATNWLHNHGLSTYVQFLHKVRAYMMDQNNQWVPAAPWIDRRAGAHMVFRSPSSASDCVDDIREAFIQYHGEPTRERQIIASRYVRDNDSGYYQVVDIRRHPLPQGPSQRAVMPIPSSMPSRDRYFYEFTQ